MPVFTKNLQRVYNLQLVSKCGKRYNKIMNITNGYLTDLHIHSSFSYDSNEKCERYIEKALERGDKSIGFVQHYDYDCFLTGGKTPLCDLDAYKDESDRVRSVYGEKIKMFFGIEFGYDEHAEKCYAELVDKYKFDYVINSVHLVGSKDCCLKDCWGNRSADDIYKEYLEKVYKSVNANYPWQIVGHLGYPARYAPENERDFSFENYSGELTDILKSIIANGKFLEINTSTKSEMPFMPFEDILKKYAAFGGKFVTFGSDAHSVERYCENVAEVEKTIMRYGLISVG